MLYDVISSRAFPVYSCDVVWQPASVPMLCASPRGTPVLKLNVSGLLQLTLRPLLEGTGTGSTSGKGLIYLPFQEVGIKGKVGFQGGFWWCKLDSVVALYDCVTKCKLVFPEMGRKITVYIIFQKMEKEKANNIQCSIIHYQIFSYSYNCSQIISAKRKGNKVNNVHIHRHFVT